MSERKMRTWHPPADWLALSTVDVHTAGEPLRIITSGFPDPPGATMLAKRRYAEDHLDDLRRITMWEPRGHADMYGCVITEPVTDDADFGVLFLHNAGFSTMCGHGIIAVATVAADAGWKAPTGPVVNLAIDTPAGRVDATAHLADGRVSHVTFRNVPSFVRASDVTVAVPGIGDVCVDVAFGGAFYAYVAAAPFDLALVPTESGRLIDIGMRIKEAVAAEADLSHPSGDAELAFLYGTIFVGAAHTPDETGVDAPVRLRNVCVFADGEVDRSPTGTGVSGRLAIEHLRNRHPGRSIEVESILGTTFTGRIVGTTTVGGVDAVIPEIGGSAHVVGTTRMCVDPADPLAAGFLIR